MDEDIADIRSNIKAGKFVSEAAVSHGIVRRVLEKLSWPVYEPDVVIPEYSVEGGRVDFALCHPPGEPIAFVEVKRIGQGGEGDRQLFSYAFHQGVPLAVLMTGQEWHFFLPAERGDYDERRVYKLDLMEREPRDSVARLKRYLDYPAICSGRAIESARVDHRDVAKERDIQRFLPEAWRKLVDEGDEILLDLIAEKVESMCGFRPGPDAVASFLSQRLKPVSLPTSPPSSLQPAEYRDSVVASPRSTPSIDPASRIKEGYPWLAIGGRRYSERHNRDIWVRVLQLLADRDPEFLDRFVARPKGGKRPYVARSRRDLYPDTPHLAEVPSYSRELRPGSGWWVDVNLSTRSLDRLIRVAGEVAGLRYGSDLEVRLF